MTNADYHIQEIGDEDLYDNLCLEFSDWWGIRWWWWMMAEKKEWAQARTWVIYRMEKLWDTMFGRPSPRRPHG